MITAMTDHVEQPSVGGNRRRKRRGIRQSDVKAGHAALSERGISPTAVDFLPDGTIRWHLAPIDANSESSLDQELRDHEAKHGGH